MGFYSDELENNNSVVCVDESLVPDCNLGTDPYLRQRVENGTIFD